MHIQGLGMVEHAYNPNYRRGRAVRIMVWGQPGQNKLIRPFLKKQNKPGMPTSVIPDTQITVLGGSRSEAGHWQK
jgi:hypothetical protein